MGFYQKLSVFIPKQSCVLCTEQSKFCICEKCASKFSNSPNRCQSCAQKINENLNFCGKCLSHSPYFNRTYTLYDNQNTIAQLIKIFKYNHQLCIGNYFSHQLYDLYKTLPDYDAIIPMPLSKARIKERGFNQVLELLRKIKQTSVIIDTHSVKRIKKTQYLAQLNSVQRKAEIDDAFSVTFMPYKKILLADDVMTTGTSLNELARTILRNTNVTHCEVLTLART